VAKPECLCQGLVETVGGRILKPITEARPHERGLGLTWGIFGCFRPIRARHPMPPNPGTLGPGMFHEALSLYVEGNGRAQ